MCHPGRCFPITGAQGCHRALAAPRAMGASLLGLPVQAVLPSPCLALCRQIPQEGVHCVVLVLHSTLVARQTHRNIFCSAKQEAALPHFRGFTVRTKTESTWKHVCSKRRLITQYRTFFIITYCRSLEWKNGGNEDSMWTFCGI